MSTTEQVKALIAAGMSRPQIAHKLGITYHHVRTICDQIGIPRRAAVAAARPAISRMR